MKKHLIALSLIALLMVCMGCANNTVPVVTKIEMLNKHTTKFALAVLRVETARNAKEKDLMISRLPQIIKESAALRKSISDQIADKELVDFFGKQSYEANVVVLYDRLVTLVTKDRKYVTALPAI